MRKRLVQDPVLGNWHEVEEDEPSFNLFCVKIFILVISAFAICGLFSFAFSYLGQTLNSKPSIENRLERLEQIILKGESK